LMATSVRQADPAVLSLSGTVAVRRWQRSLRLRMIALDLMAAVGSGLAIVWLRFGGASPDFGGIDYRVLVLLGAPLWLVVVGISGGYEARIVGLGTEEFRRVA